ncbi:MAG TPA: helix-turn-helix transcriptional regulator [Candidatus Ornithoclostridium excrementipullorum]|nr:helix-turn-helix transcriptional regulator [Candidatus Ornithoclostridium excrementipullorum]
MDIQEKISANIRTEILSCGKTRREIAEALGVSCPTVSQYVSGRIQPSLATFAKLCAFLGVSADELLGLDER